LLATWVTFAPCFLWIFLGAPFVETLGGNRALAGGHFRDNGCCLRDSQFGDLVCGPHDLSRNGAGSWLRTVVRRASARERPPVGALAAAAVLAIFRFKFGMLWTLVGSCAAGIVLFGLGVLR
jgi:chromate transporter